MDLPVCLLDPDDGVYRVEADLPHEVLDLLLGWLGLLKGMGTRYRWPIVQAYAAYIKVTTLPTGRRYQTRYAHALHAAGGVDTLLAATQGSGWRAFDDQELALGVTLALAWSAPETRALITEQVWRGQLAVLLQPIKAAAPSDRRRGHVRLDLNTDAAATRPAEVLVIRENKRGTSLMKPKRVPPGRRRVRDLLSAPAEADLRAVDALVLVCERARRRNPGAELAEAMDELFRAAMDVTELSANGRILGRSATPYLPQLRVREADGATLILDVENLPEQLFSAGDGWVIDPDWVFRPLAPGALHALRHAMAHGLPEVPRAALGDFVQEFVLKAPIPVRLDVPGLESRQGAPRAHVRLSVEGAELLADVAFDYEGLEVDLESGPVVQVGEVLVQRDRDAESALRRQLIALVGPLPATLYGDATLDFLAEGLPTLTGWVVDADRRLVSVRRVGTPSVRMKAGVDWFDLQVEFKTEDGTSVPFKALQAAWRTRRRYAQLKDKSWVRLPDAWLDRFGHQLDEVEELRRGRKRLGPAAAGLAGDLLGEAEGAAEALAHWRELAARIRRFDHVPERALPKGLECTLRDYQHRGYRWLAALADLGLGGVLADDMGLGKTVQALAFLLDHVRRHRRAGPALVVAPTSVIHNWVQEAARFTPSLRVHLHYGASRGEIPAKVDVVVTSFALMRLDTARLSRKWRAVILDEAQHIKNPQSGVAQAARALNTPLRFALTGTPLENHLLELWSLFEFLLPGFFGGMRAFRDRYATPIQSQQDEEAMAKLKQRIRPFILRRLKREVAAELPPRTTQVLTCVLGPKQRALYESIREAYRDEVLRAVQTDGVGRSTLLVMEALMRLRRAACDPGLVNLPQAEHVDEHAKLDLLMDLLDEAIEEGHRTLVFSQWPSFLKLVRQRLEAQQVAFLYLDGSTRNRGDLQARWNDPAGPPVFLISVKAGGTGLNLVGADHVVHLDPWWNPAVENQATDRAHRIGQTRPVSVYKLVAADTCEIQILALQARKQALFDAAVDADRMLVDQLTAEDIQAVFDVSTEPVRVPGPRPEPEPPAAPEPRPVPARPTPRDVDADPVADLLADDGYTTNARVRAALDVNRTAAIRLLLGWVATGRLRREGGGRGTRYVAP
jgi:hypothetical protein